jgi:transcription antitermination factor NusG
MLNYENPKDPSGCPGSTAGPASPFANAGPLEWFALAVKPRYDKAVARTLAGKGYQTLVPLYKKRRQYAARYMESELPLFPGYVFCRFHPLKRLPILTTPGVTQILGAGNTPIPLCESEIDSLLKAIESQLPLEPFPYLEAGQKVRINQGALVGVEGVVVGSRQRPRLVLSITLLQRSVLLEIDRGLVSAEQAFDLVS